MNDQLPGAAPVGRRMRLQRRVRRPVAAAAVDAVVEIADPPPGRPVQRASATIGAVFVLIGLLGFLPGITAHVDGLGLVGHDSGALMLGAFSVSVLHNVIHLVAGVAGIVLARRATLARGFLLVGGGLYLALGLLGWFGLLDELPANAADHWLHTSFGALIVACGLLRG
jgi:uncharacterized protein DUF4383